MRALFWEGGGQLKKSTEYSLQTPPQWEAISRGESDRAFRTPSKAIVSVTSSCERDEEVSLPLLTKHLLIGSRKQIFRSQSPLNIHGKEALFSDVEAQYGSKSTFLNLVVLKATPCVFDFSMVASNAITKTDSETFLQWIKSFKDGKD